MHLTFALSSVKQIARCKLKFVIILALNLAEMSNGVGTLRMTDVDYQINTSLILAPAYLLSPAVSGGFTLFVNLSELISFSLPSPLPLYSSPHLLLRYKLQP